MNGAVKHARRVCERARRRRLAGVLAIALASRAQGNAALTVYLPATEEGDAIRAELVLRGTRAFLTLPDASASAARAFPVDPETTEPVAAADAPIGGTWEAWALQPERAWPALPRAIGDALAASADSRSEHGPWSDLVETRLAGRTGEPFLVLRFERATCSPLARFGGWPLPRAVGGGSFIEDTQSAGRLVRNPRALWEPRLDEILLVTIAPAEPQRNEVSIVEPSGASSTTGEHVLVLYRLRPTSSLSDEEAAWLERTLSRPAFEPLVPDVLAAHDPGDAATIDGPASPDTTRVGSSAPASLRHRPIHIAGSEGPRSDLLHRRALVLVEEGLGAPRAASRELRLALERTVVLSDDPVTQAGLWGEAGERPVVWTILALRLDVLRGVNVEGSLAAPHRLTVREDSESF